MDPYYGTDLAWVHDVGYAQHAKRVAPGIVQLLRDAGLGAGARVLDIGCGSGCLARILLDAGFAVYGVDASPAMIALARRHVPAGRFDVLRLPTHRRSGSAGALPRADAVVSTGHALNYLATRDDIARGLIELAGAVRPGGILAIDLMAEARLMKSKRRDVRVRLTDDWAIYTRLLRPAPDRLDRAITVFRRVGKTWRRSDEVHHNLSFDVSEALRLLRSAGIDAVSRPAFGSEKLPDDLIVLTGSRGPGRRPARALNRRRTRS